MSDNVLYDIRQVRKTYGIDDNETIALDSVDLVIEKGEFTAIMGPSGSGKSTLLHMLGFLDVPSSGEISFLGKDTASLSPDTLASIRSQEIGFIFQSFNLLPRTTVLDNVILPLLYRDDVPVEEREKRAAKALKSVGLSDRLGHKSNELSGGQQQRTAIARALVTDPSVIVADEPTGNLDSSSGEDVLTILEKLHASGKTVLVVTHDEEVAQRTNRIIRVRDGKIEKDELNFSPTS